MSRKVFYDGPTLLSPTLWRLRDCWHRERPTTPGSTSWRDYQKTSFCLCATYFSSSYRTSGRSISHSLHPSPRPYGCRSRPVPHHYVGGTPPFCLYDPSLLRLPKQPVKPYFCQLTGMVTLTQVRTDFCEIIPDYLPSFVPHIPIPLFWPFLRTITSPIPSYPPLSFSPATRVTTFTPTTGSTVDRRQRTDVYILINLG